MIGTGSLVILWLALGDAVCGNPTEASESASLALCRRIEQNQGLLSLLALIATLMLAFGEWRRANAAELRERERTAREAKERIARFFAAADAIVDEFNRLVAEGRKELEALHHSTYGAMPVVVTDAARGGSEALRLLANTGEAPPAAVMAMVNMARAMAGLDDNRSLSSAPGFWLGQISAQELALERAKAELDRHRGQAKQAVGA